LANLAGGWKKRKVEIVSQMKGRESSGPPKKKAKEIRRWLDCSPGSREWRWISKWKVTGECRFYCLLSITFRHEFVGCTKSSRINKQCPNGGGMGLANRNGEVFHLTSVRKSYRLSFAYFQWGR